MENQSFDLKNLRPNLDKQLYELIEAVLKFGLIESPTIYPNSAVTDITELPDVLENKNRIVRAISEAINKGPSKTDWNPIIAYFKECYDNGEALNPEIVEEIVNSMPAKGGVTIPALRPSISSLQRRTSTKNALEERRESIKIKVHAEIQTDPWKPESAKLIEDNGTSDDWMDLPEDEQEAETEAEDDKEDKKTEETKQEGSVEDTVDDEQAVTDVRMAENEGEVEKALAEKEQKEEEETLTEERVLVEEALLEEKEIEESAKEKSRSDEISDPKQSWSKLVNNPKRESSRSAYEKHRNQQAQLTEKIDQLYLKLEENAEVAAELQTILKDVASGMQTSSKQLIEKLDRFGNDVDYSAVGRNLRTSLGALDLVYTDTGDNETTNQFTSTTPNTTSYPLGDSIEDHVGIAVDRVPSSTVKSNDEPAVEERTLIDPNLNKLITVTTGLTDSPSKESSTGNENAVDPELDELATIKEIPSTQKGSKTSVAGEVTSIDADLNKLTSVTGLNESKTSTKESVTEEMTSINRVLNKLTSVTGLFSTSSKGSKSSSEGTVAKDLTSVDPALKRQISVTGLSGTPSKGRKTSTGPLAAEDLTAIDIDHNKLTSVTDGLSTTPSMGSRNSTEEPTVNADLDKIASVTGLPGTSSTISTSSSEGPEAELTPMNADKMTSVTGFPPLLSTEIPAAKNETLNDPEIPSTTKGSKTSTEEHAGTLTKESIRSTEKNAADELPSLLGSKRSTEEHAAEEIPSPRGSKSSTEEQTAEKMTLTRQSKSSNEDKAAEVLHLPMGSNKVPTEKHAAEELSSLKGSKSSTGEPTVNADLDKMTSVTGIPGTSSTISTSSSEGSEAELTPINADKMTSVTGLAPLLSTELPAAENETLTDPEMDKSASVPEIPSTLKGNKTSIEEHAGTSPKGSTRSTEENAAEEVPSLTGSKRSTEEHAAEEIPSPGGSKISTEEHAAEEMPSSRGSKSSPEVHAAEEAALKESKISNEVNAAEVLHLPMGSKSSTEKHATEDLPSLKGSKSSTEKHAAEETSPKASKRLIEENSAEETLSPKGKIGSTEENATDELPSPTGSKRSTEQPSDGKIPSLEGSKSSPEEQAAEDMILPRGRESSSKEQGVEEMPSPKESKRSTEEHADEEAPLESRRSTKESVADELPLTNADLNKLTSVTGLTDATPKRSQSETAESGVQEFTLVNSPVTGLNRSSPNSSKSSSETPPSEGKLSVHPELDKLTSITGLSSTSKSSTATPKTEDKPSILPELNKLTSVTGLPSTPKGIKSSTDRPPASVIGLSSSPKGSSSGQANGRESSTEDPATEGTPAPINLNKMTSVTGLTDSSERSRPLGASKLSLDGKVEAQGTSLEESASVTVITNEIVEEIMHRFTAATEDYDLPRSDGSLSSNESSKEADEKVPSQVGIEEIPRTSGLSDGGKSQKEDETLEEVPSEAGLAESPRSLVSSDINQPDAETTGPRDDASQIASQRSYGKEDEIIKEIAKRPSHMSKEDMLAPSEADVEELPSTTTIGNEQQSTVAIDHTDLGEEIPAIDQAKNDKSTSTTGLDLPIPTIVVTGPDVATPSSEGRQEEPVGSCRSQCCKCPAPEANEEGLSATTVPIAEEKVQNMPESVTSVSPTFISKQEPEAESTKKLALVRDVSSQMGVCEYGGDFRQKENPAEEPLLLQSGSQTTESDVLKALSILIGCPSSRCCCCTSHKQMLADPHQEDNMYYPSDEYETEEEEECTEMSEKEEPKAQTKAKKEKPKKTSTDNMYAELNELSDHLKLKGKDIDMAKSDLEQLNILLQDRLEERKKRKEREAAKAARLAERLVAENERKGKLGKLAKPEMRECPTVEDDLVDEEAQEFEDALQCQCSEHPSVNSAKHNTQQEDTEKEAYEEFISRRKSSTKAAEGSPERSAEETAIQLTALEISENTDESSDKAMYSKEEEEEDSTKTAAEEDSKNSVSELQRFSKAEMAGKKSAEIAVFEATETADKKEDAMETAAEEASKHSISEPQRFSKAKMAGKNPAEIAVFGATETAVKKAAERLAELESEKKKSEELRASLVLAENAAKENELKAKDAQETAAKEKSERLAKEDALKKALEAARRQSELESEELRASLVLAENSAKENEQKAKEVEAAAAKEKSEKSAEQEALKKALEAADEAAASERVARENAEEAASAAQKEAQDAVERAAAEAKAREACESAAKEAEEREETTRARADQAAKEVEELSRKLAEISSDNMKSTANEESIKAISDNLDALRGELKAAAGDVVTVKQELIAFENELKKKLDMLPVSQHARANSSPDTRASAAPAYKSAAPSQPHSRPSTVAFTPLPENMTEEDLLRRIEGLLAKFRQKMEVVEAAGAPRNFVLRPK